MFVHVIDSDYLATTGRGAAAMFCRLRLTASPGRYAVNVTHGAKGTIGRSDVKYYGTSITDARRLYSAEINRRFRQGYAAGRDPLAR